MRDFSKRSLLMLLLGGAALYPTCAVARDNDVPPPSAVPVQEGATVYTPADFERYVPRTALDMVNRIPGFTLRGESGERGLGQTNANLLIDGQRVSAKSDSVFDQLSRISTDRVERIEIVEGTTLGIPGLSGQVANVITRPSAISGRFAYRAGFRPKYAKPSYFGGEVSVSGTQGSLEWTVAYDHGVGRGGAGGSRAYIYDGDDILTEQRDVVLFFKGEFPQLTATTKWTSPGGTVLNVNANVSLTDQKFSDDELRNPVDGVQSYRDFDNPYDAWSYELGGDVEFGLGPGRLKLVALDRFTHGRSRQSAVLSFADDRPDEGFRYANHTDTGERIARSEYSWDMLGGSWQLDAEAAYNRLDRSAQLFDLDPGGEFVEIPFPTGSGGVREDRYESILTHSRTLAGGLTLQIGAGAEYSQLSQTGTRGLTRTFYRPKGSANLAWSPTAGLDLSLKVERKVGQLSFGDFLASVQLGQGNGSAGNIELVPPQSWETDLEIKKDLGTWGSTTVTLLGRWYEDLIEIIPVAGGLEANGNIDGARRLGVDWVSTFELEKLGFKGAKLDTRAEWRKTRLTDPLTGEQRQFSGERDRYASIELRHDIPGSNWAWGAGLEYFHVQPYFRLGEVGRDYEGPIYTSAFIEHKNVLGMTANLSVFNITDGRARLDRTVWDGYRDRSDVVFREVRNLSVQPIINFKLSGDF